MAHLVITSGQLEGRRIEVSRELVVGRENVDVEIDDAELSRRHFAVRPVAGGLEVEDLGSRNGTRVDGTRIDGPTRVRHGAIVTVGVTMLTVEAAAGGAREQRGRDPCPRLGGHSRRPGSATAGAASRTAAAAHRQRLPLPLPLRPRPPPAAVARRSRSGATRHRRARAAARPPRGCGCHRR